MKQQYQRSFKKKASVIAAFLVILALLASGTYAYEVLFQHDSNELENEGIKYDATLNEKFTPPTNWNVNHGAITKQINVKNTGLTDGTYGDVYVRLQLKEYMEISEITYVYYDMDNDGKPDLYMTEPNGEYTVFASAQDALNAYPGHDVQELTDAVSGTTGWFVRTQAGDKNGQYGKYVIKSFDEGTPESLVNGVVRAPATDKGNHEKNGECEYTPHVWNDSLNGYSDTELFMAYVKWTMGDNVITIDEWDGMPTDKWILDTQSDAGWIYWGRSLKPAETTANVLEAIELVSQPDGKFYYVIHTDMEAKPYHQLGDWTDAPQKVIDAYAKIHAVVLDPDGGYFADGTNTFPSHSPLKVRDGSPIVNLPTDPVREGYQFAGWAYAFDDDDNPSFWDFSWPVRHNMTLWAVWSADTICSVVLDPDGGYFSDGTNTFPGYTPLQIKEGAKIENLPIDPVREGYQFSGWAYAFDENAYDAPVFWDFNWPVLHNMTLWAVWEANTNETFTVIFDLNGATSGFIPPLTVKSGDTAIRPADPIRPGYVFMGWAVGETTMWDFSSLVNQDMTLHAVWKMVIIPDN